MKKEKACKVCRAIFDGEACPNCGSKEATDGFKGRVVILDPENSELAKKLELKSKGNFAIKVR